MEKVEELPMVVVLAKKKFEEYPMYLVVYEHEDGESHCLYMAVEDVVA